MSGETQADSLIVGVVGAGTMGAGIAQALLGSGHTVKLYEPQAENLERGVATIRAGLSRSVERGRTTEVARTVALDRLTTGVDLSVLDGCAFVIEAAPESPDLKRELFARLGGMLPEAVLASNTSSLSITGIASAAPRRERVVGMHFFNPVHSMALVEVVAGDASSEDALTATDDLARAMGKSPVRAADTPGFIVNRVNRAFYSEALRMLGERTASVEDVDSVLREAGGFPMGPFELMDLIGLDVNYTVTCSVYEAYFHEPRFRPHPIQRRMIEAGRLGRKTGRGFYEYGE
ncbi:MAG: 3-hydroxyacyl-CoA dehydrogenase NAD-binding domain-containing protein [Chloroflexia bacterium]